MQIAKAFASCVGEDDHPNGLGCVATAHAGVVQIAKCRFSCAQLPKEQEFIDEPVRQQKKAGTSLVFHSTEGPSDPCEAAAIAEFHDGPTQEVEGTIQARPADGSNWQGPTQFDFAVPASDARRWIARRELCPRQRQSALVTARSAALGSL